jgi:hypothetical protein
MAIKLWRQPTLTVQLMLCMPDVERTHRGTGNPSIVMHKCRNAGCWLLAAECACCKPRQKPCCLTSMGAGRVQLPLKQWIVLPGSWRYIMRSRPSCKTVTKITRGTACHGHLTPPE